MAAVSPRSKRSSFRCVSSLNTLKAKHNNGHCIIVETITSLFSYYLYIKASKWVCRAASLHTRSHHFNVICLLCEKNKAAVSDRHRMRFS